MYMVFRRRLLIVSCIAVAMLLVAGVVSLLGVPVVGRALAMAVVGLGMACLYVGAEVISMANKLAREMARDQRGKRAAIEVRKGILYWASMGMTFVVCTLVTLIYNKVAETHLAVDVAISPGEGLASAIVSAVLFIPALLSAVFAIRTLGRVEALFWSKSEAPSVYGVHDPPPT